MDKGSIYTITQSDWGGEKLIEQKWNIITALNKIDTFG